MSHQGKGGVHTTFITKFITKFIGDDNVNNKNIISFVIGAYKKSEFIGIYYRCDCNVYWIRWLVAIGNIMSIWVRENN